MTDQSASFEHYLENLRHKLESIVTDPEKQVLQISNSKESREFREKLGIFTGGFFFYNPQESDVKPLFVKKYPFQYATIDDKEDPTIDDKDNRKFLDEIFLAWRKQDKLNPLENQGYPTEYFSYLPPQEDKSFLGLDESVLRAKYSAHYCTLGEMLFFMFSWRFLSRIAQKHGWGAVFPQHDVSLYEDVGTEYKPLWSTEQWWGCRTREKSWIDYIKGHQNRSTVTIWNKITKNVDDCTDGITPWMQDWRTLLLIEKEPNQDGIHKILPSFTALTRFAGHVAGYMQMEDEKKGLEAAAAEIVDSAGRAKIEQLVDIDRRLKQIAWSFLHIEPVANEPKLTARDLLDHLHCLARFPVYPYFYWLHMHPVPKSHLTFPVWRSHLHPTDALIFEHMPESRKECTQLDNYKLLKTNVVMTAAIGLEPFEELDWTVSNLHDDNNINSSMERMQATWEHYNLLARPVVDDSYYVGFSKRMVAIERQTESALIRSFAHRMRNILPGLSILISEIDEKKDNKDELAEYVNSNITTGEGRIKQLLHYLNKTQNLFQSVGPQEFDVVTLVEGVIKEFDEAYSLKVELKGSDRPVFIAGSRELLWWVIDELFYNARNHLKKDLKTEVILANQVIYARVAVRNQVRIEITDNGSGMSQKTLNLVRQGLYASPGRSKSGTGLRRSARIVKDSFHGELQIDSEKGRGTTITLFLPMVEKERQDAIEGTIS